MSIGAEPMGEVREAQFLIPETMLDMFGHVNNAAYLTIFEQARWNVVAPLGFGVADIQKNLLGPTLLEVNLQFRRELRARETITIRTFVTNHSGKVTTLRQILVKANGEEACIADFKVALFDLRARKLVEPTPEWKAALGM
jgi:YbgC/YbaW family acyl-CoA thioester hydrolase